MNWLEQARQNGVLDARNSVPYTRWHWSSKVYKKPGQSPFKKTKELSIPSQDIELFLQKYTLPLLSVLSEIEQYTADGEHSEFQVSQIHYDYFFIGDTQELGNFTTYSQTKQEPSYRGLTDYLVYETHAFGAESRINFWTGEYLAIAHILPTARGDSRLGGATYVLGDYAQEVDDSLDTAVIENGLRAEFSKVYAHFIHKQARYFHW